MLIEVFETITCLVFVVGLWVPVDARKSPFWKTLKVFNRDINMVHRDGHERNIKPFLP